MNSGAGLRDASRREVVTGGLPWALVLTAALAIRLSGLGHFSYWLDEVLETYLIRSRWGVLWSSLRDQGLQAPLDYAIRKAFESFGPGEAARRVPGVIWGVGCVAAFGLLFARRAGRAAGLACAAMLALAPYHVRYSQELRPYSLGLFLLAVSLLSVDRFLERPEARRLALLYAACLGTLYALYLAALVLLLAAASILLSDCFDPEPGRRAAARRFLKWSPAFAATLAVGYLPWWPVLVRALGLPPDSRPPAAAGTARVVRWFAYFGFRGLDLSTPGAPELIFALLVAAGGVAAWRRPRLRFALVWSLGGLVAIEILERRHSQFDSIFHWLPAGLGLTGLAGVGAATLLGRRMFRPVGAAVLVAALFADVAGVRSYFQAGRADWRPLARFLASTPGSTRIFTENPYTLFCAAFYFCGPDWPPCRQPGRREMLDVHGDVPTLLQAWDRGQDAWLVLGAGPRSDALRTWSSRFPSTAFPTAEGDAMVRQLPAEVAAK